MKIGEKNFQKTNFRAKLCRFFLSAVLLVQTSCAHRNINYSDNKVIPERDNSKNTLSEIVSQEIEPKHAKAPIVNHHAPKNNTLPKQSTSIKDPENKQYGTDYPEQKILMQPDSEHHTSVSKKHREGDLCNQSILYLPTEPTPELASIGGMNSIYSDDQKLVVATDCNCESNLSTVLSCTAEVNLVKQKVAKKISQLELLLEEANNALRLRDELDALDDMDITNNREESEARSNKNETAVGRQVFSGRELLTAPKRPNNSKTEPQPLDNIRDPVASSKVEKFNSLNQKEESISWYPRIVKQGNIDVQMMLGSMYYNGESVLQDYKLAESWYRKAADQGEAVAQYYVAKMYHEGKGVTQNFQIAADWYAKAAEQGNAYSQYNLGLLYNNGQGVTQDDLESIRWFELSMSKSDATSHSELGLKFYLGEGVPQDLVKAYVWIKLAADAQVDFLKARDLIYNQLSLDKQEQAKSMALKIYN